MNNFWRRLEAVQSLSGVEAEWRRYMGDWLPAMRTSALLQRTHRRALSFPCLECSMCSYRVTPRGKGFVGKCKNEDGGECEDKLLIETDVEVWELDVPRLGRAIGSALKCDTKHMAIGLDRTWQIASLGSTPLPLFLMLPRDEDSFSDIVARVVARFPTGFILLAPTSKFCTALTTELLARVNAGFFDLETRVKVVESGRLHAPKSGAELFSQHLPEQRDAVRESELKQVFRLYGELLSMGTELMAPPVTVFDKMVRQKKSQSQVAKECKCSRSLITERVKSIVEHFGIPMKRLVTFSDALTEHRNTIKGDRYAKRRQGEVEFDPQQDGYEQNFQSGEDEDGKLPEERQDFF